METQLKNNSHNIRFAAIRYQIVIFQLMSYFLSHQVQNYSEIAYRMRSVEEIFKPASAKIHAATLNLQCAIEKERDDQANASKKLFLITIIASSCSEARQRIIWQKRGELIEEKSIGART